MKQIIKRFCCLLLSVLFVTAVLSQQNYSGLLNKELLPEVGGDQIIGNVVDRLLYGANFTGSVTTIKVLDDADVSLTIGVNYAGYKEGYIHVWVADASLNKLDNFPAGKIAVDKDKKEGDLTLSFDRKAYPENQPFNAPILVVLVSKDDKGTNGVRTVFKLNKKFNNPLSPENTIIQVTLAPVGSAAALPAVLPPTPDGTLHILLPQRNVYEKIKTRQVYLYKQDTLAAKPRPVVIRPMIAPMPGPVIAPPARRMLISSSMRAMSVMHTSITPPATPTPAPVPNKDPLGPDDNPLSFWDFIYSDVDFESQDKITSISLNIYPDKNPNTGIYYYLPIAYDLKYDKENQAPSFNMNYGAVRTDGSDSKVHISGTLSSGISLYEVQFIKNLMDAYRDQNPSLTLVTPLPLPISETPVITLGDELKSFGITDVQINNTSSITDPINFSWMTDATTATELEDLMKANSGIVGTMKIKPTGTSLPVQEIPVRIRLIDENTFGRFGMLPSDLRAKNWRNETPVPIRLKYLHCMIIGKNKDGKQGPIIYSWDLGGTMIPSRCQVQFNTPVIPQWLDNYGGKQARIWLDYSVVDTCSSCNEAVFEKTIISLTRPQLSDVVFHMLPFFDDYKISYMDIEMRSTQGDPASSSVVNYTPVHINRDTADYVAGKIYLPRGTDPAFDLRITVVTKDGAEAKSEWIPHNSLSIPFGSVQLKQLFPSFNSNH